MDHFAVKRPTPRSSDIAQEQRSQKLCMAVCHTSQSIKIHVTARLRELDTSAPRG